MKLRNATIIVLALGLLFCSIDAQGVIILDSGDCERPRLNNHGEVVWARSLGGENYGIFSNIRGQISSGFALRDPDINDDGEIIWRFGDGGQGANGISSNYRGAIFVSTSQDPAYDTQRINNNGEIISSRYGGSQVWSNTRGNLPSYGSLNYYTEINDQGEVVYMGLTGSTGNTKDIYSTERGAITSNSIFQDNPDINNDGEIVWDQNGEIWSNIRGKIGDGSNPSINDLGEIVWSFDGEIFSSVIGQITFNSKNDRYPHINNLGQIAWLQDNSVAFIPEPTSLLLLGLGVVILRKRH